MPLHDAGGLVLPRENDGLRLGVGMRRRALLGGAVAWSVAAGAAFAEDELVYFEGFLVFDRKIELPPQTYITVYVTHSWGIQHGDGYIVLEKAEISNSNLPWGFKIAARYSDVFDDDDDEIIVTAWVKGKVGHDLFSGGVRKLPHELIGHRQRIEMHYNDRI